MLYRNETCHSVICQCTPSVVLMCGFDRLNYPKSGALFPMDIESTSSALLDPILIKLNPASLHMPDTLEISDIALSKSFTDLRRSST